MTAGRVWRKVLFLGIVSQFIVLHHPVLANQGANQGANPANPVLFAAATIDDELQRGMDELRKGNLSIGHQWIQTVLQRYRRQNDRQAEKQALQQLSEFYLSQKDYETAIEYAKLHLVINQGMSDRQGIGGALSHFGRIYQSWQRVHPTFVMSINA